MAVDYSALVAEIEPLLLPPFPRLCAPEWLPYWENLEFAYVNAYGFGPMDVVGMRGPDPTLMHAGILYKPTAFGLSAFWYDDATTGRRASFRLPGPWSSAGTDRDRFSAFVFGYSEIVPDGTTARMYLTANSADQQWCIGHDWLGGGFNRVMVAFRHSLTEFRKVGLITAASAETWRSFGITYDGVNGAGWLNGVKVGSVATVGAYKGTPRISVGATGTDTDKEAINGPTPVAYVWKNRVLTDNEMARLAADPFGPLRVPSRMAGTLSTNDVILATVSNPFSKAFLYYVESTNYVDFTAAAASLITGDTDGPYRS